MKILKADLDSPEYDGYRCPTSESHLASHLHDYDMPVVNGLEHVMGMGCYSAGENYEFETPYLHIRTSIHRSSGVSNTDAQRMLDAENFIHDLIGDFDDEVFVVQDHEGDDFINAHSVVGTYVFGDIALAINAFCRKYSAYNVAKKYLNMAHTDAERLGVKRSRLVSPAELSRNPAPALDEVT
jgi:hypothetical protein